MLRRGDGEGYGEGQVLIGSEDKEVMVRQGREGGYVEARVRVRIGCMDEEVMVRQGREGGYVEERVRVRIRVRERRSLPCTPQRRMGPLCSLPCATTWHTGERRARVRRLWWGPGVD